MHLAALLEIHFSMVLDEIIRSAKNFLFQSLFLKFFQFPTTVGSSFTPQKSRTDNTY